MKKRQGIIICFAIAFSLLTLNFLPISVVKDQRNPIKGEILDSSLGSINNINALIDRIDQAAKEKNINQKSVEYVDLVETYVKRKFVWGLSNYKLNENWISALAGKLIWADLAMKTESNEILEHDYALCSQQGIVMIGVLKRKGIPYRANGFTTMDSKGNPKGGHYAIEAYIQDDWYYFDPTFEPNMKVEERTQNNWMCDRQKFASHFRDSLLFYELAKTVILTAPNYQVARNSRVFHTITHYLSRTLWLVPFLLGLFLYVRKK